MVNLYSTAMTLWIKVVATLCAKNLVYMWNFWWWIEKKSIARGLVTIVQLPQVRTHSTAGSGDTWKNASEHPKTPGQENNEILLRTGKDGGTRHRRGSFSAGAVAATRYNNTVANPPKRLSGRCGWIEAFCVRPKQFGVPWTAVFQLHDVNRSQLPLAEVLALPSQAWKVTVLLAQNNLTWVAFVQKAESSKTYKTFVSTWRGVHHAAAIHRRHRENRF